MSVVVHSFAELVTFLNKEGVPNGANLVEHVVEIPVENPPLKDLVHVRWEKQLPYIQLVCVMVRDVPAERIPQIEAACTRANNTIAFPGFGFDYARRAVYHRHTLLVKEGVAVHHLQQLILSVASVARDFLVPFQRIREGEAGDRVLEMAVEFAKSVQR
jgi:hypothetical protein